MKYKISIIIPVFNVENYIRKALESIVKQSIGFENLEVIMVDDCSTDNSKKIIDEYADKYDNFIAIYLPKNSGAAGKPRNIGIKRATADYLMFLDPDDYYANDACEILYEKITQNKAGMVFGKYNIHYENGNIITPHYSIYETDTDEIKINKDNRSLFYSTPSSFSTKIFKRDIIDQKNIVFPEGIVGEDLAFVTHYFLKSNKIYFINKNIMNYRKRINENKSITYNRNYKYLNGLIKAYKYTHSLYKDYGEEKEFAFTIRGNLQFWMKQFILCDQSISEKRKTLESSWFLFKKYRDLGLTPQPHFTHIFESIINKKFDETILLADGLFQSMKDTEKIPESPKTKNHSKYYKISIIIPVFNVENYIRKALESIVKQSIGFENLEVIMVDDCSTDNSKKIIDEYADKYDNFIAIYLPKNSGAAGKPRNIGIKRATADYLMFLDPDDYYANDACEILYEKITQNKADMVFGTFTIPDENGKRFVPSYTKQIESIHELKVENIDEYKEFLDNPPQVWTRIFKRDLILDNEIKFPPKIPSQDLAFVVHALLKAEGIIFIDKTIVHYNNIRNQKNNKSITQQRDFKYMYGTMQAFHITYDICKHEGKEEYFILFIMKNKLIYWINQFILSELTIPEKKKVLNLGQIFFKKCQKFNLSLPPYLTSIFKSIANNNFDETIMLADRLIDLRKSQIKTPSLFKTSEKPKKLFILCDKVPIELGGLGRVVLHKSQLLKEKGYDVSILTTLPDNDSDVIKNELRKRKQLASDIDLINIYTYYKNKNNQNLSLQQLNNARNTAKIYEKDYQMVNEYKSKKFVRYFKEGKYLKSKKWNNNGLLNLIEYFDENGVRIKREEYLDGFLSQENSYQFYDIIRRKRYFTKDGFCYLTEIFDHKGLAKQTYLFDRFSNEALCFDNINDFHKYFLTEVCKNFEDKPYLICEGSGPTPTISNIDPDVAYLISVLHVNPYTGPYNFGGPIRCVGVLKNIENLDALIMLTEKGRDDIIKELGDYENTHVIPNLIPCIESLNCEKKSNKISIFSRIAPEKNLSEAIESFRIVANERDDAILEIFGRATLPGEIKELKKIKKLIKKLQLENNVFIKGYATNVYNEMAESIATLLTSKSEGFGMSILESMMCSTPVISYDINYGPSELIDHDVDGFLVKNNNIEQMAKYIIKLLDNPEKTKVMGKAAKEKALKKYSKDKLIPLWEKLFKTIPVHRKTRLKKPKINLNIEKKKSKKKSLQRNIQPQKGPNNLMRLILNFYPLYILFNKNNKGIKNAIINLKGYRAIKKNQLLDHEYYLTNNVDVKMSGIDPILHYIYHGYKEKRRPSHSFDGDYYLKTYKDVQQSNINPLVHYSLYGIKEGRNTTKITSN